MKRFSVVILHIIIILFISDFLFLRGTLSYQSRLWFYDLLCDRIVITVTEGINEGLKITIPRDTESFSSTINNLRKVTYSTGANFPYLYNIDFFRKNSNVGRFRYCPEYEEISIGYGDFKLSSKASSSIDNIIDSLKRNKENLLKPTNKIIKD